MRSDLVHCLLKYQYIEDQLIGLEKANQLDEFSQYYSFKNYFYKKKRKISYFGKYLFIYELKHSSEDGCQKIL